MILTCAKLLHFQPVYAWRKPGVWHPFFNWEKETIAAKVPGIDERQYQYLCLLVPIEIYWEWEKGRAATWEWKLWRWERNRPHPPLGWTEREDWSCTQFFTKRTITTSFPNKHSSQIHEFSNDTWKQAITMKIYHFLMQGTLTPILIFDSFNEVLMKSHYLSKSNKKGPHSYYLSQN